MRFFSVIISLLINLTCYAAQSEDLSFKLLLGNKLPQNNPTLDNPINEINYLNVKNADIGNSFHQGKTVISNLLQTNYTDNITVKDLEEIYENNFCQLNQEHGVTLDSKNCQELIKYLANQTHFDLNQQPIINNRLGISRINFKKIQYKTTVNLPNGKQSFTVSGGLMLPSNAPDSNPSQNTLPKNKLKGILVYFQGTQFDKSGVGSNINFVGTQIIAALFASQGYIVILPDYIGMGDDYKNIHPYVLYPLINVKTASDMLNGEVKKIIQTTYSLSNNESLKLFSMGYSEGGAYSLWFRSALQDHPEWVDSFYQPKHSIGMEGAYNLSDITANFLFKDIVKLGKNKFNIQNQSLTNLTKPLLAANCLISYATYANQDISQIFNPDFFQMNCTGFHKQANCNIENTHLNLLQAFQFQNLSPAQSILYSSLAKHLGIYYSPASLPLLAITFNNTAIPLTANLNLKDTEPLKSTLVNANLNLSSLPDKAVSIVTLSHDSVVSPNNFDLISQLYPKQLANQLKLDENQFQVIAPFSYNRLICKINPHCSPVYSPVDHPQAQLYEYLYALHILNQH